MMKPPPGYKWVKVSQSSLLRPLIQLVALLALASAILNYWIL